MSNHLSQEQFARCFVGVPTNEERQHLLECAECNAELRGFGNTISSFRSAIHSQVDARLESPVMEEIPISPRRKLRWALAAAAVLLIGSVPLLTIRRPQAEPVTIKAPAPASPDDLMNAINAHLARTIPAPMEPMMSLIPSEELGAE